MEYFKIFSLLIIVLFAVLTQAHTNFNAYPDVDEVIRLVRNRRSPHHGVTGPVHTYVKTDKHAHFKWGVRHHVGHKYAGGGN